MKSAHKKKKNLVRVDEMAPPVAHFCHNTGAKTPLDQLHREWVPKKIEIFHCIYPVWCKAMDF